jgi:hypothetical protein
MRLYQVVVLLVAKGDLGGAEMRVRFGQRWEKVRDETEPCTKESVLGGFLWNKGCSIHEEGTLEVLLSFWVAGGQGWVVGFRV